MYSIWGPDRIATIPAGSRGLGASTAEKLKHITGLTSGIGCGLVPDIVMGDDDRTCFDAEFDGGCIGLRIHVVLGAGLDRRGSHIGFDPLWIVEKQHPATPVAARVSADRIVLVPGLCLAIGVPVVTMARAWQDMGWGEPTLEWVSSITGQTSSG